MIHPLSICQTSDILILGAGITGLAAAYSLKNKYSVRILERSNQIGGVIQSQKITNQSGEYLLETGPDCFMNMRDKPWALDLALELDLQEDLIKSKNKHHRVFVLENNKFKISDHQDKTVKEFLGVRSVLRHCEHSEAISPCKIEQIATSAPLPRNDDIQTPYLSFKNGMQTFPKALADQLGDRIILGQEVCKYQNKIIICESGQTYQAKIIISTLPARITANLFNIDCPNFKTTKTKILYLAYPKNKFKTSLDAFGLIIPKSEHKNLSAVTFVNSKFDHRSPRDINLFRIFTKSNFKEAKKDFENLFKPESDPVLEKTFELEYADPKYSERHYDHVKRAESSLPQNIFIAGSPYKGVGVADCVFQAKKFLDFLNT